MNEVGRQFCYLLFTVYLVFTASNNQVFSGKNTASGHVGIGTFEETISGDWPYSFMKLTDETKTNS